MKYLKFLVVLTLITACQSNQNSFNIDAKYISELDSYFNKKMKERQDNYLQLTALYKLHEGNNTFGKDSINSLSLNIDYLPPTVGSIELTQHGLKFRAAEHVEVKTLQDSIVTEIDLSLNEYGSSEKLNFQDLSWQIITRSEQQYLRIWDAKNPAIKAFKGFQKFEPNNQFIFNADFTYYENEKTEIVKAEVDGKRSTSFIGKLSFNYQNKSYSLEVGSDGFTMVGDATTGDTTYGGGRYLYVVLPETNGKTSLDFNKLYNPPCSFSEFTTCLYPPRQNHMPFKILAGEKIMAAK
jgi:hypothetical protein